MTICYLGLGSNLKFPKRQLHLAISAIIKLNKIIIKNISGFYYNPPMGVKSQPNFYNLVIKIDTSLSPEKLFKALKSIECKQNRITKVRWGARNIDIDILLYGSREVKSHKLQIPHPGILERDFVLVPLAEITTSLYLPNGTKIPVAKPAEFN